LEAFKLRDHLHVGLLRDSISSGNCEVIAESTEKCDFRFILIMIINSLKTESVSHSVSHSVIQSVSRVARFSACWLSSRNVELLLLQWTMVELKGTARRVASLPAVVGMSMTVLTVSATL
jgi:hypothetical protein